MTDRDALWRRGHMKSYFSHLHDGVLGLSILEGESLENWTSTHDPWPESLKTIERVSAIVILAVFALPFLYGVIVWRAPLEILLISLLFSVLICVLFILPINYKLRLYIGEKRWVRKEASSMFLAPFPGMIKRYHRPMSECVQRLARGLADEGLSCWVYGFVLDDEEGDPHGTVFVPKRYLVRISVWRHPDDRGYTLVHMASNMGFRRKKLEALMPIVDQSIMGHHQKMKYPS